MTTTADRRALVEQWQLVAGSERRACQWLGVHRSAMRYRRRRPDDPPLRQRLRELAAAHPRWGGPMLTWRLRQEGVRANHKRIRRLYRTEGLAVRRQRRKRVARPRVLLPSPQGPNERWAMDFMRDTLADGRAFRALTLVDHCTRECPVIEVEVSLGADRVVAVLERLAGTRGLPRAIVVDNGPEFQSRRWTPGRTGAASHASLSARANRWRTPSSNVLTGGSVMSASTSVGSPPNNMQ